MTGNRSARRGAAPLILILTFIFSVAVHGAPTGTIHGTVLDRATREPIPAASVQITGTTRGVTADLEGQFTLSGLEPGIYHVIAYAIGYEPQTIHELSVSPARTQVVEFLLNSSVLEAEEVTVTAPLTESSTPDLPTSTRSLRYEEVRRAPGAIEDAQRMVQAMPGVINQDDQSNEIVVRGGSPLENLTIIDGIEVDNTNHFTFGEEADGNGGGINGLNTEFLREVTFAAGGFSARYGDRLSSVLDLDLREGSRTRYGGAADLNIAGIGGYLEGPLPGIHGSCLASVHKSYLDLIPESAIGVTSVPHYWNAQFKTTTDISAKHSLTVNGLYLEESHIDDFEEEKEDDVATLSSGYDALNFNGMKHVIGTRLRSLWGIGFTDLIIARSLAYNHWDIFEAENREEDLRLTTTNRRTEITDQLHLHWTGRVFGSDLLSAGVSLKPIIYDHELWADGDSIVFNDGYIDRDSLNQPFYDGVPDTFYYSDYTENVHENALKYGAYLQYTWKPLNEWSITGGLRHDGFDYSGKDVLGPRVSVNWKFYRKWSVHLAWGIYHQSQHMSVYMNETSGGANRNLPYSRAEQYITGITFSPSSSSILSLEGYYKDYDNLPVREEDIIRETTGDQTFESEVQLAERTKTAWGLELFAQKKLTRSWYGNFSYSYGESESEDPAYGSYPAAYDSRHIMTGVIGYQTCFISYAPYHRLIHKPYFLWLYALPVNGDEVTFSTRYRYYTGRPYTRQVWYEEGEASPEPIYEGHWEEVGYNNLRYPDYSRWDIRIDNKYYLGGSSLVFFLELQNILDRKNIARYYYNDDGEKESVYQFRLFFILGIRYEF